MKDKGQRRSGAAQRAKAGTKDKPNTCTAHPAPGTRHYSSFFITIFMSSQTSRLAAGLRSRYEG
jgi:hypothetical protein